MPGSRRRGPFHYVDKGNLVTIGRMKAVGEIKGVHLSLTLAWLGWLFIHLFYLVGLQNRFLVFIRWTGELHHQGTRSPPDHGARATPRNRARRNPRASPG